MNLALFDFDGTISTKDSTIEFTKYLKSKRDLLKGAIKLLPQIVLYKLNLYNDQALKESFIEYFFRGIDEEFFKSKAQDFSLNILPKLIRSVALDKINWHKTQKDRVIIISASFECILKPWCDKNNLELIATKLEFINHIVTGKLLTKNCKGKEKVNRIKELLDLNDYQLIYAYGDSRGDKEMLKLANKKFYKIF
ncbi:HAD-IB family hydrolase [Desulfurella sp.]|uniref:HAD-IB family hydrolase n=1 Tax=Desulfurella sp. TaxID=1962857 RepID=UPI0025C5EEE4|nr:HAD-IB family hydrolase [Desulfurella sp.]